MTFEILKVIALLCTVAPGGPHTLQSVDEYQLECHNYYINCMYEKASTKVLDRMRPSFLRQCIQERKIK